MKELCIIWYSTYLKREIYNNFIIKNIEEKPPQNGCFIKKLK
jgi:hypothetical protein